MSRYNVIERIRKIFVKDKVPDFSEQTKDINRRLELENNADEMRTVNRKLEHLCDVINTIYEKKEKGEPYLTDIFKVIWNADVMAPTVGYQTALDEMMRHEGKYTDEEWKNTYLDAMRLLEQVLTVGKATYIHDRFYACQIMHYIETKHPSCVPDDKEKQGFRDGPRMFRFGA